MKVVWTLCFLLGSIVGVSFGAKLQRTQMAMLRGGGARVQLAHSLLTGIILLISFTQFWFLTNVFPAKLILLLLCASAASFLLFQILGAISGITLPEKRRKIGALSLIFSAQQKGQYVVSGCVLLLVAIVAMLGTLWVYWTHPIGDPAAKVLIAFFHFTLVPVVFLLMTITVQWPIVTSESLDDDVRNAQLANGFARIIENTILLLFPFWLFSREITQVFGSRQWPVPPFWLMLSVPLLLFLLGNLVPFFVGVYSYRAQMRAMGEWLDRWLHDVSNNLALPKGPLREKAIDESLSELKQEIQSRFSDNTFFHDYQELELSGMKAEERPLLAPVSAPLALPATVAPTNAAEDGAQGEIVPAGAAVPINTEQSAVLQVRQLLQGFVVPQHLATAHVANDGNPMEEIQGIILENRSHLVDWDIRFDYLDRTLKLYEAVREAKSEDISAFIDKHIKENKERLKALNPKRNVLAGASLTALSSLLVWLIKEYASDLSSLIETLVHGS